LTTAAPPPAPHRAPPLALAALAMLPALCASACALAPLAVDDEARVRAALEDGRVHFPELEGRQIVLGRLEEETVFFQSSFTPASALQGLFDDRPLTYSIEANPRAFAAGIPPDALRGVLGHELAHTLDYELRTDAGVEKLRLVALLPLVLSPSSNDWERRTDLVAVDRGFGEGLLRYRAWQFRLLSREAVREKRSIYYGPLELSLLIDVKARCPAVFASFLSKAPGSAREIATRCP
jgi:hypothetical protein